MAADVIEVPNQRTYTVPRAIAASAAVALHGSEAHHDADLARKLSLGRADLDDVVRIHEGQEDTGFELRGGEYGKVWAEKIIEALSRDLQRATDETLQRYEYNPQQWEYAGITAPTDEDVITDVVRYPVDSVSLKGAQALTASGWKSVVFDFEGEDRYVYGVAMDADLFAFTASALMEGGVTGVLLAYAEPYCFLATQPLLAAGPVSPAPDDTTEHVYAIVDGNDTTAVVDLVMITRTPEGPAVWRRNGGMWQLEPTMLDTFLSSTPPPLVELQSPTKEQVISQVDASSANQMETDDEGGHAATGPGLDTAMTQPKAKKSEPHADKVKKARPERDIPGYTPARRAPRTPTSGTEEGPSTKPPRESTVTASGYEKALADVAQVHGQEVQAAVDWYYSDEGYASGFDLDGALQTANDNRDRREQQIRRHTLRQAYQQLDDLHKREQEMEHILLPVLAAGNVNKGGNKVGQAMAENLRKYWVHGEGALKIRWGTPSDWKRCVRHLRKYLGARAKGYCQLRHREATGVYTGDKRNVGRKG